MRSLIDHFEVPSMAHRMRHVVQDSLNFYRVHLIAFTIVPLIFSGIMYGTSTEFHISYIDCLFNCMSAMTVTGLATVNLSTLSVFQQALLFVQMIVGSLTFVSIIMIAVRLHFFRSTFRHLLEERQMRRKFSIAEQISRVPGPPFNALKRRFGVKAEKGKEQHEMEGRFSDDRTSTPSTLASINESNPQPRPEPVPMQGRVGKAKRKVSKGMIKRVEGGGMGLVNPMGWYDAERGETPRGDTASLDPTRHVLSGLGKSARADDAADDAEGEVAGHPATVAESPEALEESRAEKVPYAGRVLTEDAFPRSKTIAFDDGDDGIDHDYHRDRGVTSAREGGYFPKSATVRSNGEARISRTATTGTIPPTYTLHPIASRQPDPRLSGFGGFPTPLQLVKRLIGRVAPKASRILTRSFTVPRSNTITGRGTISEDGGQGREVPYISFSAVVGRNSRFTALTDEQKDELGGVEYRALRVLLYIVIGYFIFIQVAAFVIIAPYVGAGGRYDEVFTAQPRLVTIPWFALFQSFSAFTNTGLSLVDLSMIPFQNAYLMIVVMIILIFAGNTAFPVFLRLTVWSIYRMTPDTSRVSESLKFLLDHPRRCFTYMFPSTSTWVLALVMLTLTLTDWVSFLVLDLGNPVIVSIPVGERIASAFIQSSAVRSAGFGIVPLGSLAPAVKVLYVIMMYISVYPIAMSVRSTNVYEERSLGLFHEDGVEEIDESEEGAQAVAKYVGWHARRQLAFDIWWLGLALWLICIIERRHLNNAADTTWFNIFNIIFELVSAYGTVGLSLGVAYDNFSLSGSFRKLSKLVVILVMLRGRHRGLPVAIDRAVMLPKDFTAAEEEAFEEVRSRSLSRRVSNAVPDEALASSKRRSQSNLPSGRRESISSAHQAESVRRDSSPPPTRTSSAGNTVPTSPTTLQFSLPRSTTNRQHSSTPVGTGTLSPVRENKSVPRSVENGIETEL